MAEEVSSLEQARPVDDTPKFRKALLGIRSLADIKAILTHQEYEPHVHMCILLAITFLVGAVTFAFQ